MQERALENRKVLNKQFAEKHAKNKVSEHNLHLRIERQAADKEIM